MHKEDVAHFNHTSFDALDVVAGPANEGEHEDVDHISHGDFALSDANSFHQNQIEPSRFAELDGFGRGAGDPTQRARSGGGSDERIWMHGEALHAGFVPEK